VAAALTSDTAAGVRSKGYLEEADIVRRRSRLAEGWFGPTRADDK
jgi:hypothetical protein